MLFLFVNMGPYRSENFKMLLLLQIAAESFETFHTYGIRLANSIQSHFEVIRCTFDFS